MKRVSSWASGTEDAHPVVALDLCLLAGCCCRFEVFAVMQERVGAPSTLPLPAPPGAEQAKRRSGRLIPKATAAQGLANQGHLAGLLLLKASL